MARWFGQEQASSCVAACAWMVLFHLGQERSEAEIRRLLASPRYGAETGHGGQIAAYRVQPAVKL